MDELLAKYPNYDDVMRRLSVKKLKLFYINGIYNPYYVQFFSSAQNRDRLHIIRELQLRSGFKNKSHCINEIKRIFDAYRKAVPQTPEDHEFFQKKALKMLQAIVYVAYHCKPR